MDTHPAVPPAAPRGVIEFIRSAPLPSESILEGGFESFEESAATGFLDPGQTQAVAVGSGVTSFLKGVDPARRRAIADSVLLAQLVANQKVEDRDRVDDWYDAYFGVLANLGWIIENRSFSEHEANGQNVEAHEAILAVAATVLGPVPTALAVVTATLDGLKKLENDKSWITLFNRDQQDARAAHFQIALAEEDAGAGCSLRLMAFALTASARLVQVVFFKFRLSKARLRHLSTTISIDPGMLAAIHPEIQRRVAAFQASYLRTLPALALPA